VARQADPRDARVGYASLSDTGRELLGYAQASVNVPATELTNVVPSEQLEPLSMLLAQLAGVGKSTGRLPGQ
jgi:hypothetical protein